MPEPQRDSPARRSGDEGRAAGRLRILIIYAQPVFWSMGEGRGAAFFSDLPSAIAARGHEVRVSLPGPDPGVAGNGLSGAPDNGSSAAGAVERYRGFDLSRAPARGSLLPAYPGRLPGRLYNRISSWVSYQRWGVAAARRICPPFQPDLVLGMGYYEAPVAARLARKWRLPNVTRLFGNSLSLSLRDPLRFYANFPEVVALRTAADLIVLTDDGADCEAVIRRLHVPPDRIRLLRNGVDFDHFSPAPAAGEVRRRLGLRPDQPLLLTVTRMSGEKKLERAITALRGLLRHHPDAALALLGDGPERESLARRAADEGVSAQVHFPGPIAQEELPEWYRSADLVLSLLDRTNASNPVFEAMACGRVAVALEAGTSSHVLSHGATGVLVPRDDLPRLGEILAHWLDRPQDLARMGTAAREGIRKLLLHKRERLAMEVDLLEEVVRRHRSAAS